jgi:hypothetical protein
VAPLEPWEKVLIGDPATYQATVHGQLACQDCHQGAQSDDKEVAHDGLVADPSADPVAACGECHPDIAETQSNSLHATQAGYWTDLDARSLPEDHPQLEEMFGNHCASCHATCGDCHVSQPNSVDGGFLDGHLFQSSPSMTRNCTACHGSRVGNEYLGKNEGVLGDVHFRQGRMSCLDCHTGDEMHGETMECSKCHAGSELTNELSAPAHRYDGMQLPSCESCHSEAASGLDGIDMHSAHGGDLSCQVCHSVAYSNCDSCHVALSDSTGNPYFTTDGTYLGFYIGRNPRKSYSRPYDYVPVRHIPMDREDFAYYGQDLLPNFDALPTWVYSTPHNIQLDTPQAESCNACHGNPQWFLTSDRVAPEERDANAGVIIESIPDTIEAEGASSENQP